MSLNEPWYPDQLADYNRLTTDAERLRFFESNPPDTAHMAEYLRLKPESSSQPESEPPCEPQIPVPEQKHVWYKSPEFWVAAVSAAAAVLALFR